MPTYTSRLIDKKEIARNTIEFHFEKPQSLEFRAGNSFDWTLINPLEIDPEGNTRSFSSTAAPFEKYVAFATRMRDTAFKRALKVAESGFEIKFEGPFGSFQLHNDVSKRAVFLAGGIGITPFLSMLKQATHEKTNQKITLFYSDKTPKDMAYLQEIETLEKQNPNFTFVATMTKIDEADTSWPGERGRIDNALLNRYLKFTDNSIYYLAGPPEMVNSLRGVLMDLGVDEDNMKWEEFTGY